MAGAMAMAWLVPNRTQRGVLLTALNCIPPFSLCDGLTLYSGFRGGCCNDSGTRTLAAYLPWSPAASKEAVSRQSQTPAVPIINGLVRTRNHFARPRNG